MRTQIKPHIHILAMGGTIAGRATDSTETVSYRAGAVAIDELLEAVPQINDIADITCETVAAMDSKDITVKELTALAKKANACLRDDAVDGIVITHGTDTLEESAFFLSLTTSSEKPLVLTGAMRPSTALSADGPLNLFDAVRVAASPLSKGRGILVTFGGSIEGASDVTKAHTARVNAFCSPNEGSLGSVEGGIVHFFSQPTASRFPSFSLEEIQTLPPVVILYGHVGESPLLIRAAVTAKARGIVYAGTGMGSLSESVLPALQEAQARGLIIVRASRTGSGPVLPSVQYPAPFVASGWLSPQKARILLQLALAKGMDANEIQQAFGT